MSDIKSSFRRTLMLRAAALLACGLPAIAMAAGATADTFPSRPIRLVVPFPAGGGTDTLARLVGKNMSEQWGQPVIVENIAGASGQVGMAAVARAEPDGYTIVLGITSFLQAPVLYKNLPYDIYTDFRPLTVVAYNSNLWLVPTDSPLKTLDDLIALAKNDPNKVSYGSYGSGSSSHLHAERFKRQTGIEMVHVPYKGAAPLIADILGGHVTVGLADVSTSAAHIKGGKARVLAVDGNARVAIAPDAPQMKELGYEGFESNGWFGFLAPAKTPEPIVQKLSAELNRIIRTPDMQNTLEILNLRPGGTTPDETAAIMQREGKSWEAMVRDINLTLD